MVYETEPENFKKDFEVAVCICEHNDEILLLLRQDWETAPNKWCAPGGRVEKNEKPSQAVIRETKEETSVEFLPDDVRFLKSVYVVLSESHFISHVFYANLKEKPKVIVNKSEHKDYKWVTLREALKMDLVNDAAEGTLKIYQQAKK